MLRSLRQTFPLALSATLFLSLPFLSGCASNGGVPFDGESGYVSMFDGKSLDGWRCAPASHIDDWSIVDGTLLATGRVDRLVYLVWHDEDIGDFELKLRYKFLTEGNSGVEFRARVDTSGKRPFEGYHADIGHVGIGKGVLGAMDFHFASREELGCPRGTDLIIDADGSSQAHEIPGALTPGDIKVRDWNDLHIVVEGNRSYFTINGRIASSFTDNHPEQLKRGSIGLQIHDAGMQVAFKDLWIKRS